MLDLLHLSIFLATGQRPIFSGASGVTGGGEGRTAPGGTLQGVTPD